ncbi:tRNA (guanine(46)-N(7))-methyltransferase TrmB [Gluconobacter wancherniae]|uniref:tRNA (guanine(46)-N(7))-methyltransferase TrmB n=1 Tax=Gluconobacter wancherniae TaxID=1307955 RepID=UPI0011BE2241|nr:tRNA (guanine(46)-N(7))-methyltransferase TrmB [Gluconobacter wancherniae]MBF0854298.1 tRNA (guanosine(46)-N7)-methyltransferase TrmB [Gluconobacter wancherniae]MBS1062694.1 tRNA (guanosine(46)-N7)-methyltransferase TrmB [Gluconobacter wancherniae]
MTQSLKPQPERLYGRQRGHPLRARQQALLEKALPRLTLATPKNPHAGFSDAVSRVFLEIGFGGGEHAVGQAELNPDVGYIASEVFENGLCSLLSRLVPEGEEENAVPPPHFRIWPEDARILLRDLPDQSLDQAYLMFPDPWPKARHAKRRFVHPENIVQMARVLKPGAVWRVASDHPVYQEWVTEVMGNQDLFDAPPPATERPEGWSPTRYEAKAFREGRFPFYWTFTRRP